MYSLLVTKQRIGLIESNYFEENISVLDSFIALEHCNLKMSTIDNSQDENMSRNLKFDSQL